MFRSDDTSYKTALSKTIFDNPALDALPNHLPIAEIQQRLDALDEREVAILGSRFGTDRGKPRTLEEVGYLFDLSKERIRQIQAKALAKLRRFDFEQ